VSFVMTSVKAALFNERERNPEKPVCVYFLRPKEKASAAKHAISART